MHWQPLGPPLHLNHKPTIDRNFPGVKGLWGFSFLLLPARLTLSAILSANFPGWFSHPSYSISASLSSSDIGPPVGKNIGRFYARRPKFTHAPQLIGALVYWFGSETVFGASSEFLDGGLYAVIEDLLALLLCLIPSDSVARKHINMNFYAGDYFEVRVPEKKMNWWRHFSAPPYVGYIAAQLVAMDFILHGLPGWKFGLELLPVPVLKICLHLLPEECKAISVTDFAEHYHHSRSSGAVRSPEPTSRRCSGGANSSSGELSVSATWQLA